MSLLDKASLVLIPSGTKEGTVFCQKPTGVWQDSTGDYDGQDGTGFNGQLDFTRASDATYVNSEGFIETARTNFLLKSNNLQPDYSIWYPFRSTVTGGQSGYDGTNNAWLLEDTTTSYGELYQNFTSSIRVRTLSVYAKANTSDWMFLSAGGGIYAYFDLKNGAYRTFTGAYPTAAIITDAGNGWWRCSVSGYSPISYPRATVRTSNSSSGTPDGTGSIGDSIFLQNFQVEAGGAATEYIDTNTSTVSVGPTSNVPRLDYSVTDNPSLLMEPQRTNYLVFNSYPSLWLTGGSYPYGASPVVTEGYADSPQGIQNASRVYFDCTGGSTSSDKSYVWLSSGISPSGSYVLSFYIKSNTSETQSLKFLCWDNAVGTITATTEWQRVSQIYSPTVFNGSDRWGLILTGDVGQTADVLIYGAQLENGTFPYPTSLIPTDSTTVTRAADTCSKTGVSEVIGQTEGTLFAEVTLSSNTNLGSNNRMFSIVGSSGHSNNAIYIEWASNGKLGYYGNLSGSSAFSAFSTTAYSSGQTVKIAVAYKSNDTVMYVNGVLEASDNTTTGIPVCSIFALNELYGLSSGSFEKHNFNQAALFPTRLTNSELETLTSL